VISRTNFVCSLAVTLIAAGTFALPADAQPRRPGPSAPAAGHGGAGPSAPAVAGPSNHGAAGQGAPAQGQTRRQRRPGNRGAVAGPSNAQQQANGDVQAKRRKAKRRAAKGTYQAVNPATPTPGAAPEPPRRTRTTRRGRRVVAQPVGDAASVVLSRVQDRGPAPTPPPRLRDLQEQADRLPSPTGRPPPPPVPPRAGRETTQPPPPPGPPPPLPPGPAPR
jgi:hypothetical protein